jgi:hypothetical protein
MVVRRREDGNLWAVLLGEAILLASMQFAIGSVEQSSRFSVMSFAKDEDTLQRAADALSSYMVIGLVWAVGVSLILYSQWGKEGLIAGLATNALVMFWIFYTYYRTFQAAAHHHHVKEPTLFRCVFGCI